LYNTFCNNNYILHFENRLTIGLLYIVGGIKKVTTTGPSNTRGMSSNWANVKIEWAIPLKVEFSTLLVLQPFPKEKKNAKMYVVKEMGMLGASIYLWSIIWFSSYSTTRKERRKWDIHTFSNNCLFKIIKVVNGEYSK